MFIPRLARLAPQQLDMPPAYNPMGDVSPNMGGAPSSPLASLGSADSVGTDNNPFSKINYNTPALGRYQQFINKPPTLDQPSRTRQVLGAIASMGAGASPSGIVGGAPIGFKYNPEAAAMAKDQVLYPNQDRKNQQYQIEAGNLGKAADIEEKNINNQRAIAQDITMDKIRQQQANQANDKIQKIYETKQAELQAKVDKAQADLAEKAREADARNKTAEERAQTYKDALELHRQISAATAEMQKAKAERDQALNDAKIKKMQDDVDAAAKRASIAEEALKAKTTPSTTVTESKPAHGRFYNLMLGTGKFENTEPEKITQKSYDTSLVGAKATAGGNTLRKPIPNTNPVKYAISKDGGKTWQAE